MTLDAQNALNNKIVVEYYHKLSDPRGRNYPAGLLCCCQCHFNIIYDSIY